MLKSRKSLRACRIRLKWSMRYRNWYANFGDFCDAYTYTEGGGHHMRYAELQLSELSEFSRHIYLQPIEGALLTTKSTCLAVEGELKNYRGSVESGLCCLIKQTYKAY